MGLLGSIRGTDRTPDQEQAIPSLEATLPDGWKVTDFPKQLVGRRPVKHETCGAPPPITPTDQRFRAPWAPLTATAEEDAARASAVALLPEGAVVSPTDEERFGALTVSGDRHLPDQTGIAAFGPDPAGAYQALAARLRGGARRQRGLVLRDLRSEACPASRPSSRPATPGTGVSTSDPCCTRT